MTVPKVRRALPWIAALGAATALGACGPVPEDKRASFAAYQTDLQARGLLRTDRVAADVPYSNRELAEHFRRIAFYTFPGDARRVAKPLTKWTGPLRYAVVGQRGDMPEIDGFMAHMSALTALDIESTAEERANFLIMVLDDAAQAQVAASFEDDPSRDFFLSFMDAIRDCGAISGWTPTDPTIRKGLVYLHGDLAGLYRTLCYHEEIAQSLGLFNDDPAVRPSIFNDDEEFALLTTHDEYLLRILYDPRLKPGMTPPEAMPVVTEIIEELRPGL